MSGEETTWTIVKFDHDDTVEAVPTRWLENNFCYWPKYDSKKLTRAIKNCDPTNPSWDKFKIIIFRNGTYNDYTKARNKLKKAEYTSDLNSDNEQRRIRRPLRLSTDSESSDDSEYENQKTKTATAVPAIPIFNLTNNGSFGSINSSQDDASKKNSNNDPWQGFSTSQASEQRNKEREPEMQKCGSEGVPCSCNNIDAAGQKKTQEYFKQIIRKLSMIELVLSDLKIEVNNIKGKQNIINKNEDVWNNFSFPLLNMNDLKSFEDFLACPNNMQESIDQLAKVGGDTVEEFVKRAIKKLLTNQIQTEYSWLGQKQKKKFAGLFIATLITGAAFKLVPECTDKKIEDSFKNYLKRAPERVKNEKKD